MVPKIHNLLLGSSFNISGDTNVYESIRVTSERHFLRDMAEEQ